MQIPICRSKVKHKVDRPENPLRTMHARESADMGITDDNFDAVYVPSLGDALHTIPLTAAD